MTGWGPEQLHPKASLVVLIPDVLGLFTLCHGARPVLPTRPGHPGVRLEAVCQDCRRRWVAELVADTTAEFGLRAHWEEREVSDG